MPLLCSLPSEEENPPPPTSRRFLGKKFYHVSNFDHDFVTIFSSVGIDADDEKVKMVADELAGKNIEELIEEGKGKLAGGAAPATRDAAPAAAAKVEEDNNEGFGLFD